jgi:hypothetical protein
MGARRDWVAYTRRQEQELLALYRTAADDIIQQIERHTVEGKVAPARLTQLFNNIHDEMVALNPKTAQKVRAGVSRSVDYGIKSGVRQMNAADIPKRYKVQVGSSYIGKDGRVRRYKATEQAYAQSTWARINKQAVDAVFRFRPEGITLSQRIWDITWDTQKALRRRIMSAVVTGESAARLSRDIRGFLVMPETLRGRTRKAYHPGQGIYKSAFKNAMRVTRTELSRAYTEGLYRYGDSKDWITGYISRVGSGNPCPICLDYDGTFFEKPEAPGIPWHPQCMCYAEPVTDETRAEIAAGE